MKTPQYMTDINIFVTGVGHLGTSKQMSLPKLSTKKDGKTSGGFEKDISTGVFEKLEAECVLDEYSEAIYSALAQGLRGGKGASIEAKGSIMQDGTRTPVVAYFRGGIDFEGGDWEASKAIEAKMKITVKSYRMEQGGKEKISIDTENMICIIDGYDYLEDLRKQVM